MSHESMTFEQAERVVKALEAHPEFAKALGLEPEIPETETGAAVGLAYPLGTGELSPPPYGAFVALGMIGSPLLGRPDDVTDADAYRAVYVCGAGRTALACVMGHAQRMERLEAERERVAESPEMYAAWLERVDAVTADTWAQFDAAAVEYCAQFGHITPAECLDVVFRALRDARAGLQQLPRGKDPAGDAKKKPSTRIGWQTFRRFVRRSLGLILSPPGGVFRG